MTAGEFRPMFVRHFGSDERNNGQPSDILNRSKMTQLGPWARKNCAAQIDCRAPFHCRKIPALIALRAMSVPMPTARGQGNKG